MEFEKTKELSVDEVKEIIDDRFGLQIKLKDVEPNHHIILKILKPIEKGSYDFGGETKQTYKIFCEYKPKNIEPVNLTVQVGENAAKRLEEKFPEESYVGKYAFFSRTSFEGKFPQFINPMNSYTEPVSKDGAFKKKDSVLKEEMTEKEGAPMCTEPSGIKLPTKEFVISNYIDEYAKGVILPPKDVEGEAIASPNHFIGTIIKTFAPENVDLLNFLEEIYQKEVLPTLKKH